MPLDFGRYNLYAMAADPLGSATVRKDSAIKLKLGDEDAAFFLKKLADRIDEVRGRYTDTQLREKSAEYIKRRG